MCHMSKVGVRELRQNASVYLARVQQGEVVEVSIRGKVVARLVPAIDSEWDRLVAEGYVRPPTNDRLEDLEPLDVDLDLTAHLLAAREHER